MPHLNLARPLLLSCLSLITLSASALSPVGPASPIDPETPGLEQAPSAAIADNGVTLLAWRHAGTVRARRLAVDGAPLGAAFTVSTTQTSPLTIHYQPDVAIAADGRAVIAWTEDARVNAQRYRSDGAPDGGAITVATIAANSTLVPSVAVAMRSNGDFIVGWAETRPALGLQLPNIFFESETLLAQQFGADGLPKADPVTGRRQTRTQVLYVCCLMRRLIDLSTGDLPTAGIDLGIADDGRAVMTWTQASGSDVTLGDGPTARSRSNGRTSVMRRTIAADGRTSGAASVVESFASGAISARPAIAMLPDGRHGIAYLAPAAAGDSGGRIVVRGFGADGAATGPSSTVASNVTNFAALYDTSLAVALNAAGRGVVAWRDGNASLSLRALDLASGPVGTSVVYIGPPLTLGSPAAAVNGSGRVVVAGENGSAVETRYYDLP